MQILLSSFLGNQDIKAALAAAFLHNRLPHAIILQGEEGLGKRTLARLIARAAVCNGADKPCGVCPACVRFLAGSHPDVRVEEGSGVSGNIAVEAIRRISEDAYKKPEEADLNVYLLFVKSRLPEASQNKLLKLMEEPPGSALFLITVPSADALLPTIRSRAQVFTLRPVQTGEAARYLEERQGKSREEAEKLAVIHGGNIGRMLGGSAQAAELAEQAANIFDGKDGDALLALTAPLIKDRALFARFARHLRDIFRDACVYSQGSAHFSGVNEAAAKRLARSCRKQNLLALVELCTAYEGLASRNLNMNLLVTAFCAKLREIVLK